VRDWRQHLPAVQMGRAEVRLAAGLGRRDLDEGLLDQLAEPVAVLVERLHEGVLQSIASVGRIEIGHAGPEEASKGSRIGRPTGDTKGCPKGRF